MQQLIDIIFPFDEGNKKEKTIEGSSASIKKEHADKEQWFQEQQALGVIQMSLNENHQRFAQGITEPKELYNKICAHYWHVEVNSQLRYFKELINVKYVDSESLNSHLDKINALYAKIQSNELKLPINILACLIFQSLPESYKT